MSDLELKPGERLDFAPLMPVSMTVLEPPADAADASRVELRLLAGLTGLRAPTGAPPSRRRAGGRSRWGRPREIWRRLWRDR